jgi:hypothetical protein
MNTTRPCTALVTLVQWPVAMVRVSSNSSPATDLKSIPASHRSCVKSVVCAQHQEERGNSGDMPGVILGVICIMITFRLASSLAFAWLARLRTPYCNKLLEAATTDNPAISADLELDASHSRTGLTAVVSGKLQR